MAAVFVFDKISAPSAFTKFSTVDELVNVTQSIFPASNKFLISAISAFIICSLSFAVYNLLLQGDFELFKLDMPIIAIAKQFGKLYGLIYTVIIGVAIFTSAASSGVRIFK